MMPWPLRSCYSEGGRPEGQDLRRRIGMIFTPTVVFREPPLPFFTDFGILQRCLFTHVNMALKPTIHKDYLGT